ncbi:MAG: protein jag [SAR202 cluster bacterium]|nr:protein jag [SAR202 cluster bacterium]
MKKNNIVTTARTVEDAIELALKQLDVNREEVEIDVVSRGKPGLLGIGSEEAQVRVSIVDFGPDEIAGDVVKTVSNVLDNLLNLMGVDAVSTLRHAIGEDGGGPVFNVEGEDSGLLIGRRGETLRGLQFLVNFISNIELGFRPEAIIDVGGYQERRKKSLQNMARNVSLKVAQSGRSITLEPMSAYDRRLVHLALSDNPEVITQSAGSGVDRQVVVSPADID